MDAVIHVAPNQHGEPCTYVEKGRRREPGMLPNVRYYALPWEIVEETRAEKKGPTLASLFPDLLAESVSERKWKLSDMIPAEEPQERRWLLSDLF